MSRQEFRESIHQEYKQVYVPTVNDKIKADTWTTLEKLYSILPNRLLSTSIDAVTMSDVSYWRYECFHPESGENLVVSVRSVDEYKWLSSEKQWSTEKDKKSRCVIQFLNVPGKPVVFGWVFHN